MKHATKISLIGLVASFCVLHTTAQRSSGELKLPPYKKVLLKNGLALLLMEQHEVPLVSFHLILRTGSVADPDRREGLALITAGLLRKGTKTHTSDQISAALDFIGGQFGAGAGSDTTAVSAEFLKKDLRTGLDLLADVLLNPAFPAEEVTKLLKQRLDGVKSAKDRAQGVIGQYFNAYLFGDHAYARPSSGDERSLAAITRDDVVKFYETNYGPGAAILATVGDFQTEEMEKLLSEKFSSWMAKPVPAARVPEPSVAPGRRLLVVDKPDTTQTFFRLGNVGIARTNPDRVWIDVVNTLFGGRFTSMINTELRIKSGLTYGAGSSFDERLARGPFFISSFTPNETTEKALDLTLEVLKRLHEKGISETDLNSAKTYIKGQFPTELETTDQLAATLAELEFFGLDERDINTRSAKVDAMTVGDAKRIIQQYFPLENLVFVLIGKAAEIEPVVKKYAPSMDRKSILQPGF